MALHSWVLGPKPLAYSTMKKGDKTQLTSGVQEYALGAVVSPSTMSLKAAEPFICIELNNIDKLNSCHEIFSGPYVGWLV